MNLREQKRRSRIIKIKETISLAHTKGQTINYEKLVAVLMVEDGLSRRVAKECIDCLINYGFCEKIGDSIALKQELEANNEQTL